MKMGPCCKNPGRVLLHILMVGLLSQVMDKANVSVNVNVEVNIMNEDYVDVDVIVNNENVNVVNVDNVNEDNPEQVLTSQVVGVINVN
jgi:hypothetical protein